MTGKRIARILRVKAFAKINLSLRVLGARDDGYHELQTRFQSIALHDTLSFGVRPGPFQIDCDDPECPTDETNLVWRAAERMWRLAGKNGRLEGLRVRIAKRIPMQAGLGGGSSDAAATVRGLAALWRIPVRALDVGQLPAALGADVPFFSQGGTALGVERGDVVVSMSDEPRSWVVLVLPRFGVNTADAFRWWDEEHPSGAVSRRDAETLNDLEGPVVRRHPQIAQIVRDVMRAGASQAAMSGSGSAVFGLFATRARAESARAALVDRSYRTMVTRTIDRATFRALSRPVFGSTLRKMAVSRP
jgi:4-diphosphocytidyl-2-C-methyl-D-erythritol kinase